MGKIKSLAVYCSSSNECKTIYQDAAITLGKLLADHQIELVYGGGRQGLMGLIATSVLKNQGKVYGVIPKFLDKAEQGYTEITELYYVDNMHQRKQQMFERADAFVILPGGFGTLDEVFEILTWKQIGLHRKDIIFLDINNYWKPLTDDYLQNMIDDGFIRTGDKNLFTRIENFDDLKIFFMAEKSNQDNYVAKFA